MSGISVSFRQTLGALSKEKIELLRLLREEKYRQQNKISPQPRVSGVLPPTSSAQRRLWFIDQLEVGSAAYHIATAARLRGSLDRSALQAALDALVRRHEVLRTAFETVAGEPRQKIAVDARFALEATDLSSYDETERERQVRLRKTKEAHGKFDLGIGPLIRGQLLKLAPKEHVLLITMHHVISDGWSMNVFLRELQDLYAAHREGRDNPLEPLPIQYADYAHWQWQWSQTKGFEEQLSYWLVRLKGAAPQLELPTDRPRPAVQSYRGGNVEVILNAQLATALRSFAHRHKMTLFMVLYAGWAILLSRLSGQDDVVVGTPVANRLRPELEGLIGFFVNTLVLRTRVSPDQRVKQFLEQTREVTLGAYDHQELPFEQLVEALQPQRSMSRNPLFQVMFALQSTPRTELRLPEMTVTAEDSVDEPAKFDLELSLEERGEEIAGSVNYATDLFDRETVERWMASLSVLLKGMIEGTQVCIGDLPILPESERYQIIDLFNATQFQYPQEKLIHQLFEEQVQRTPEAVAVAYEERSLTYAELNSRANQLACHLRDRGIGEERLVALCVERSLEMVVGLLGILKAGGAYIPLDPAYPHERLAYMLSDAAPRIVLTQERLRARLPSTAAEVISLDSCWAEIAERPGNDVALTEPAMNPARLAYVIYTSGSTGQPKGVMVEHTSVVNFLTSMRRNPGITAADCLLGVTTVSFDIAALEIYLPIVSGAKLILASREAASDPKLLLAMLGESAVTIMQATPTTWQLLLSEGWNGSSNLKALCGGEALTTDLSGKLINRVAGLWNLYGPTETTIWSCVRHIAAGRNACESVEHIGRPIANTQIYILDSRLQPVPIGVVGEIYIGGAGVARGYLNRPELTAARFVADPFSHDPRGRVYKSGDLGRWQPDGTIEYLGRNDSQVKIRGFRIELGEIEARLARYEQVQEAAVIAREDVPGEKYLAAYITSRNQSELNVEALRAFLKATLPEYMVPSAFVVLESLPLTQNRKVDRQMLPAPTRASYASRCYEAPQGKMEETLAGIWQDLLRVDQVGRRDNFFELGGHSLLIVQMKERLTRVGRSMTLRSVYECPTLADLAGSLDDLPIDQFIVPPNLIPTACDKITPQMLTLLKLEAEHINRIVQSVPAGATNIQDIYPLAPLQEGILFHHLLDEQGGDTYVLQTLFALSSRQRLEELISALQKVIDRHDVLRTAVLWEQLPHPIQVVYREATLLVDEITLDRCRDPIEQLKEWMKPEHQRLELRKAPLVQLRVAADTSGIGWYALLQTHHLVCDSESLGAMLLEVRAHLEGQAHGLLEPVPYRNHVAQALAYARTHDAEAFFRSKLGEIDEPTTPLDVQDVYGNGSQIEEAREEFDFTLARRLRIQARHVGVSPAALFHAAWGVVMARTSGRKDVVFGTVLLGRLQANVAAERMLGMFINTLPLRLQLKDVTAGKLVAQAHCELLELLHHEQASLAMAQRCSAIHGSAPLFSALLNYRHNATGVEPELDWLDGVRVLAHADRTNYPITLSVDDHGDGFALTAQTDRRHVDPQRILGYISTALRSVVDALERAPQTPALTLAVMPERERRQVIESFNETDSVYPQESLVHDLFAEQAEHTPDAAAVMYEGQSVTYRELNGRANQLARYLRDRGVGPQQLVGICVERSVEMVIGLLAILKAGGTYVPLDPNYPTERLQYMLKDAAPQVVLTHEKLKAVLPETPAEVITLDAKLREISAYADENLSAAGLELSAQNPVYVIYTSGSTGRPKGTAMAHHSMVNLIEWHRKNLPSDEGQRVLQFAALSFDVAFQEIFSTLCTGGTLVLVDEWTRRDAQALAEFLSSRSIQRLFVPPLMLQSLAECFKTAGVVPPGSLQDVITAGEQLRISPEISSLFKHLNGCRLHNHYGPTETHVVTALTLAGDPDEWPTLPAIGQPISNTQIYILDGQRQPVPIGVTGEIYIGGAGVARGYLRRPELTAERFIADPFSTDPQARLYKTGDLGRWRADGIIEYLGRNDDQVKIRGYRIELGEIEAHLARHEQVKEAAVVMREDVAGEKRLVAYITQHEQNRPSIDDLRAHSKAVLPEYMVPSAFVILERFPLTPSGKLDRRALPTPELDAFASQQYEPPQGEVEQVLAGIWQELLRVERVGRHDNFFELGGHSLQGIKLIAKVSEQLGVRLSAIAVFQYPTIQEMADVVGSLKSLCEVPPISAGADFEEGVL
jgi:amino acid adenylation domain-containing protein